ncbi:MAG: hypothetical protein V4517_13040 [Pseudomonadota bacterium]
MAAVNQAGPLGILSKVKAIARSAALRPVPTRPARVHAENDLPAMTKRFASCPGFAHLRAAKREADDLSIFEAGHPVIEQSHLRVVFGRSSNHLSSAGRPAPACA